MRALLLSGGCDSTALCYWLRPDLAITFDYGQRTAVAEVRASRFVAATTGVEHLVVTVPLGFLGQGNMTENAGGKPHPLAPSPEWWPYRNQLLITMAAAVCAGRMIPQLVIGTVAEDRVHADGRPLFLRSMRRLLRAQEGSLSLEAPAAQWSGEELLRRARVPPRLLARTHSCHVSNLACGVCRGCKKAAVARQVVLDNDGGR